MCSQRELPHEQEPQRNPNETEPRRKSVVTQFRGGGSDQAAAPVEEWFFHRLKAGRPIPIPNSGSQVTQLGHVKDLADAFLLVLDNPKAFNQVYNISGSKYVTFDGIARACAEAGGFPTPELVHYDPKKFDFGSKKPFPLRDQHFFASNDKARKDLGWTPKFGLVDGLHDSFHLDFGRGGFRKAPDFSTDDQILSAA